MSSLNGLDYHVQSVRPSGEIKSGPVPGKLPPRAGADHPRMAKSPNSLHEDPYASDVSPHAGPSGPKAEIDYFVNEEQFGGLCPSFAFDSKGALLTLTFSAGKAFALCFEPGTLDLR